MIVGRDGQRFEFQAENEDEKMKWMTAIRRCAAAAAAAADGAAGPGSPRPRHPLLQQVTRCVTAVALVHSEWDASRNHRAQFMETNDTCGECGQPEVAWVSTNIGVTLCEECAALHRQLGWMISRVKSLSLVRAAPPPLAFLCSQPTACDTDSDFDIRTTSQSRCCSS